MPTLAAAAAAASGESCECVRLINRVQGFTATKIKARFFFYISDFSVGGRISGVANFSQDWALDY